MRIRLGIIVAVIWVAAASSAPAIDTVKLTNETKRGEVKSIDPVHVEVTIEGFDEKIPVNQIVTIYFGSEPGSMRNARGHVGSGRYEDALEILNGLNVPELALPVQQDVAFYKALCTARMALAGNGDLMQAARQMAGFLASNTRSYHYLEATEVMGDLAVAVGQHAKAEDYYATLAKAPWPDYKMRAGVAMGRARLAQNKIAEAAQAFDAVLGMSAAGDLAKAQQLAARLGKARCMAAEGQSAQAIDAVKKILANADTEDVALHAQAYNTLGTAYRKSGQENEAILAFLHVDILYYADRQSHAEALANLVELWNKKMKTERAQEARTMLRERYGNTRWAKQAE